MSGSPTIRLATAEGKYPIYSIYPYLLPSGAKHNYKIITPH